MKMKMLVLGLVLTSVFAQAEPIVTKYASLYCGSRRACGHTFNSMNRVAIACGLGLYALFNGNLMNITMEGTPSSFACFARNAR